MIMLLIIYQKKVRLNNTLNSILFYLLVLQQASNHTIIHQKQPTNVIKQDNGVRVITY
jgi:hypothetical protein